MVLRVLVWMLAMIWIATVAARATAQDSASQDSASQDSATQDSATQLLNVESTPEGLVVLYALDIDTGSARLSPSNRSTEIFHTLCTAPCSLRLNPGRHTLGFLTARVADTVVPFTFDLHESGTLRASYNRNDAQILGVAAFIVFVPLALFGASFGVASTFQENSPEYNAGLAIGGLISVGAFAAGIAWAVDIAENELTVEFLPGSIRFTY